MRVTIGVPSLNYGRFLPDCLSSIRRQTHSNLEVLIADGGSTDGSLELIHRFLDSDSRFRLVSTVDRGQADAVQKMFSASTGEVFAFLNADDFYLRNDAVELAVAALTQNPEADLVSFEGRYVDTAGAPLRPVRLRYHPLDGPHWMKYRTAVLQPATFWRREVQERYPLRTDLSYAFDVWFFFQASRDFEWIRRPEEVAGYRLHGKNKSSGVRADRILELAEFERFKFGERSLRSRYLRGVAAGAGAAERLPRGGSALKRGLYFTVNSLSFATAYRLPGI